MVGDPSCQRARRPLSQCSTGETPVVPVINGRDARCPSSRETRQSDIIPPCSMTDFLTRLCLVGAAVLFAALAAILGGRMLARQLAAIRPYLAAFLVFTFVAMNYAQKSGGTNAPLRGASVELGVENGKWKMEAPSPQATPQFYTLHFQLYTHSGSSPRRRTRRISTPCRRTECAARTGGGVERTRTCFGSTLAK